MKISDLSLFLILIFFYPLVASNLTPKLLIKIPTRARPEQFFNVLDLYYEKLSKILPYHFLITCDIDDESMHNENVQARLATYPNLTYIFGNNHTKIEAYNANIDEYMNDYNILMLASDDMVPVENNYDVIIAYNMLEYFPDYDGVLNFHDGHLGEILNTYPIIGKNFYKLFGYAYYPAYESFFCDEELTLTSRNLGKEKVLDTILLRHEHPAWQGTNKWDAIYEKNQQAWDKDKKLFYQRKQYNFYTEFFGKKPKIIALIQARNEAPIIEQCLRCISYYVDEIVFLDDGSIDETLSIAQQLAATLPITILHNEHSKWESGLESENKQALLEAGRKREGTHFIIIDADEIFTANCRENNIVKKIILSLNPSDSLYIHWYNFWRSTKEYRSDQHSPWSKPLYATAFCDCPTATYKQSFLHGGRLPKLSGKRFKLPNQYGIMHFQFSYWPNLLIKQAWYRCLEKIRGIRSTETINNMYGLSKNEIGLQTTPAPKEWFAYDSFDPFVYEYTASWRLNQIKQWFLSYTPDFFKNIDIWDVSEINTLCQG